MTWNRHPTSGELLEALSEPESAAQVASHLDDCIACRVRLSRMRRSRGIGPISPDGLLRVLEASAVLPDGMAELATAGHVGTPQPNEVWRVGRDEALLVWVRSVFDDGAADVVPVVLDTELADSDTVVVAADATPLGAELAVMVSVRTHVHVGAFLNRIGSLDITDSVNEVIRAGREGRRASGIRTGPPVVDDDDQRLEYRQALRDLLAEISPSSWAEAHDDRESEQPELDSEQESSSIQPEGIDDIVSDLVERLPGLRHRRLAGPTIHVDTRVRVGCILKVDHLDEVVLVAVLDGEHGDRFPDVLDMATACEELARIELDAGSVAVSIPDRGWSTQLLTRAGMRSAFVLPAGDLVGPTVTLEGYGLVDTLSKYLEGATSAWEVTEPASTRVVTGLTAIASRRAGESVAEVVKAGTRAQQPAKRTAYTDLPEGYSERVARFVSAVAGHTPVTDAIAEFIAEVGDD